MRMDFISPFIKSGYGNTYIYNLIDYFLRHMYLYPISGAYTNNIIILFDHYLQANLKLYAVYIDVDSYFTSQMLCMYFQKKDIAIIFAFFASHKSVSIIEKSNGIL